MADNSRSRIGHSRTHTHSHARTHHVTTPTTSVNNNNNNMIYTLSGDLYIQHTSHTLSHSLSLSLSLSLRVLYNILCRICPSRTRLFSKSTSARLLLLFYSRPRPATAAKVVKGPEPRKTFRPIIPH